MDILIDPYRYVPATPACGEVCTYTAMVAESPTTPAVVAAKAAFLAALQSSSAEPFTSKTVGNPPYYAYIDPPLSIMSGAASIRGLIDPTGNYFGATVVVKQTPSSNGRFDTTDPGVAGGRWLEGPESFEINIVSAKNAFGCFITDMGDVGGEVEFLLYNGSTLQKAFTAPTFGIPKSKFAYISYRNGNISFNQVVVRIRQFTNDTGKYDYVGFDDMVLGNVTTCTASAVTSVFYGINTVADAAKTVVGPAKTARDAWVAAVPGAVSIGLCDFESQTVGTVGASFTFSGVSITGGISAFNHTSGGSAANNNIRAASTTSAVANSGASARWNTTPSGSKWFEWDDELVLTLSTTVSKIGFYLTDLGQQNATLRVTLRNTTTGGALVYYVPKAAELTSPNGLLRFWGVHEPDHIFDEVVLQTVYYDTLTEQEFRVVPAWTSGSAIETVGIDDILIG